MHSTSEFNLIECVVSKVLKNLLRCKNKPWAGDGVCKGHPIAGGRPLLISPTGLDCGLGLVSGWGFIGVVTLVIVVTVVIVVCPIVLLSGFTTQWLPNRDTIGSGQGLQGIVRLLGVNGDPIEGARLI